MYWVFVIPKEGWARVAAPILLRTPILLLVWHQLFRIFFFSSSFFYLCFIFLEKNFGFFFFWKAGVITSLFWYDNDSGLMDPFRLTPPIIVCITGGQLGLWVGISCITLCELLDLTAQLIMHFCIGKTRKERPPDVDGSHTPLSQHQRHTGNFQDF